jgi:hypothetical protein
MCRGLDILATVVPNIYSGVENRLLPLTVSFAKVRRAISFKIGLSRKIDIRSAVAVSVAGAPFTVNYAESLSRCSQLRTTITSTRLSPHVVRHESCRFRIAIERERLPFWRHHHPYLHSVRNARSDIRIGLLWGENKIQKVRGKHARR